MIEFNLTTPGQVELTVLNILGQRASQMEMGVLPAGTHRILWDANKAGSLASGTYILRLRTANALISKKMLYFK